MKNLRPILGLAKKRKRATKKEAEELSLGQIKKKARIIEKDATAKKALAPIKIAVTQKQGKGSMTTTSLRNCTQTRFMPTLKDSDEEVESPHIMGLGSAAFDGSSSFGKNGASKSAEDGGCSGHEKVE
jgi:hypothetical protein